MGLILNQLLVVRNDALAVLKSHSGPLCGLGPKARQEVDRASRDFAEADRGIVEILRRHDAPVEAVSNGREVLLWLVGHRDSFTEVEPRTGELIHVSPNKQAQCKGMLYQYPSARRVS